MNETVSKRERTMMEEKRGLMGRKTSLIRVKVCKSCMGTSNSKTPIIYMHSAELLKYCPIGLTGSACSSCRCSIVLNIFGSRSEREMKVKDTDI